MTPEDPNDLGSFFAAILSIVSAKQWAYLIAAGVVAAVWGLKKYGGKIHPTVEAFLSTDPAGVLLACLVSFAAALFGTNGILSGAVLLTAGKTALVAMGGFALINKLLIPLIRYLVGKIWPSEVKQIEQRAQQLELFKNAKPAKPAAPALDEIK